MAHVHRMLDTSGYNHTLRICNTYCFSTATVVARTRLDVTLYVRTLSVLLFEIIGSHYGDTNTSRVGGGPGDFQLSIRVGSCNHCGGSCCLLTYSMEQSPY